MARHYSTKGSIPRNIHAPSPCVWRCTLALEIAKTIPGLYLDLESEQGRAKLQQPELYLMERLDRLV